MPHLLGAHVSVAGGLDQAFVNAAEMKADAVQIFTRNQRQWKAKPVTDEEAAKFRDAWRASKVANTVSHAAYLINLGATDAATLKSSREAFRDEILRCETLGIDRLVFHPGAHVEAGEEKGMERIIESLRWALDAAPPRKTRILVENTAGQGSVLGYTFEQVARILDGVGEGRRMGVCLDTQHTFAAGYDLRTPAAYEKTMEAIDAAFGTARIGCFHVNDSKTDLGSRVDRHEFIGKGLLGKGAFWSLLHDRRFDGLPMILEVPGEENKDFARELRVLRKLEAEATPPKAWF